MNQKLYQNEEFVASVLAGDKVSETARKLGKPESTVRDNRNILTSKLKNGETVEYNDGGAVSWPGPFEIINRKAREGVDAMNALKKAAAGPSSGLGSVNTSDCYINSSPLLYDYKVPSPFPLQYPPLPQLETLDPFRLPEIGTPEFFSTEREVLKNYQVPTVVPEKKWERFSLVTDTHGDLIDPDAERVFFDFIEQWKPTIRAHLGDFLDLAPLRNGASAEERQVSMQKDFKRGHKFLSRYFEPNAGGTNLLTLGNHDERLWEWQFRLDAVQRAWATEHVKKQESNFSELGIQWVRYNKYKHLNVGKLNLLHGFSCGVNACRQTAQGYGHSVFGHTHAIDSCTLPNLERSSCYNIGTLAKLDMSYSARTQSSLRQAHGFAHGVVNKETGDYHIWQDREFDGVWIMPSDIVEVS